MPEPRRIGDLLAETLAAIRAMGPMLTRLDMSMELYAAVTHERQERLAQVYPSYALGVHLGIPVYADRSLPPWARREHYSDGRVVTRYRLVMDPRVLQVSFRDQPYGGHRGPESHGLALMVKRFGWDYADVDPRGCAWKGARSCPYLPGLKALTDMAGLELTDWQRDYVTKAMEAHRAGRPIGLQWSTPRPYAGLAERWLKDYGSQARLISWGPVADPVHPDWRITHVDGEPQ